MATPKLGQVKFLSEFKHVDMLGSLYNFQNELSE